MHNRIVLIGFMGTGKTIIGRQLARQLGWSFADTDWEVERSSGLTIPAIFHQYGEHYFRECERNVLAQLLPQSHQVLATGGGIVTDLESYRMLQESKESGVTIIWLTAGPEVIYQRVACTPTRPLLQVPDPLAEIIRLMQARHQLYAALADYVVDTSEQSVNTVVQSIDRFWKSGEW